MVVIRRSGVRTTRRGRVPYNFVLLSSNRRRVLGYSLTRPGILRRERQVMFFKHRGRKR